MDTINEAEGLLCSENVESSRNNDTKSISEVKGECSQQVGVSVNNTLKIMEHCTDCECINSHADTEPLLQEGSASNEPKNLHDPDLRSLNNYCDEHFDENTNSELPDISKNTITRVYRRRWYVLFVYSVFSFLQGGLVDVYAVVAVSCEKALSWNDSEISIMQNWIYACYLIAVFPSCWIIDSKGCAFTRIFE